ncbi:MAG: hypothetical protein Q9221_006856 [Calogaya cf. arnoldii]
MAPLAHRHVRVLAPYTLSNIAEIYVRIQDAQSLVARFPLTMTHVRPWIQASWKALNDYLVMDPDTDTLRIRFSTVDVTDTPAEQIEWTLPGPSTLPANWKQRLGPFWADQERGLMTAHIDNMEHQRTWWKPSKKHSKCWTA